MSISLLFGFHCFPLSGLACSQLPQTRHPVTSSLRGFGSGIPVSCLVLASLLLTSRALSQTFSYNILFYNWDFHFFCHPMRRQITGNYLGKWWWGGTSSFTKAGGKKMQTVFSLKRGFPQMSHGKTSIAVHSSVLFSVKSHSSCILRSSGTGAVRFHPRVLPFQRSHLFALGLQTLISNLK